VDSCCDKDCTVEALQARQRGTLVSVLLINAVMFVVMVGAAVAGNSSALLSDSLDNLGDALTYGLSLYAVSRGPATKARVALFKGALIFLAATVVVAQIEQRVANPLLPVYEVMGLFSLAGLEANGICLLLLWRHRHEDINMSSVYECSRNDIAANLSVIAAAAGVLVFESAWPDILVAALLAFVLLGSSARVIRGAWADLPKRI